MGNKIIFALILVILVVAAFISVTIDFIGEQMQKQTISPTSFEECAAAGNPVMESYPRQCISREGKHFVEDITKDIEVPIIQNNCAPAGCSSQLCVDGNIAQDIITTCEFKEEYACYRDAVCERQTNNECGWTQTEELKSCIENSR